MSAEIELTDVFDTTHRAAAGSGLAGRPTVAACGVTIVDPHTPRVGDRRCRGCWPESGFGGARRAAGDRPDVCVIDRVAS